MEKKVDSEWKKRAQEEKEKNSQEESSKQQAPAREASFFTLVSDFALQAMVFLGQIENPMTKKKEINLPQAKHIVDTIEMLDEKTKGNLSKEETKALNNLLHQLRMSYVQASKTAPKEEKENKTKESKKIIT